jgi:hypothetical protein
VEPNEVYLVVIVSGARLTVGGSVRRVLVRSSAYGGRRKDVGTRLGRKEESMEGAKE